MQEISEDEGWEEEWKVILSSKGEYTLSKLQAMVLKQAIATGNRTTIMFKTFAIAIPYIIEFYRVKRFLKDTFQLPASASEKPHEPIPEEKWEQIKKMVYEKIGRI